MEHAVDQVFVIHATKVHIKIADKLVHHALIIVKHAMKIIALNASMDFCSIIMDNVKQNALILASHVKEHQVIAHHVVLVFI